LHVSCSILKKMTETILYRIITLDEKEQYHQIRLGCLKNFPDFFGSTYEEAIQSASHKFDSIIAQPTAPDFLMGAFKENRLIGICGFTQEKRTKTKHIGEISSMYVMPQFSGQGIGAALLNATLERAFKNLTIEQIILAVAAKNETAKTLYKKHGFVEYGRLPNYFKYEQGYETQVFMCLTRK
jgi:ribosomal protein S18 acetylase RimI-like enzyme